MADDQGDDHITSPWNWLCCSLPLLRTLWAHLYKQVPEPGRWVSVGSGLGAWFCLLYCGRSLEIWKNFEKKKMSLEFACGLELRTHHCHCYRCGTKTTIKKALITKLWKKKERGLSLCLSCWSCCPGKQSLFPIALNILLQGTKSLAWIKGKRSVKLIHFCGSSSLTTCRQRKPSTFTYCSKLKSPICHYQVTTSSFKLSFGDHFPTLEPFWWLISFRIPVQWGVTLWGRPVHLKWQLRPSGMHGFWPPLSSPAPVVRDNPKRGSYNKETGPSSNSKACLSCFMRLIWNRQLIGPWLC